MPNNKLEPDLNMEWLIEGSAHGRFQEYRNTKSIFREHGVVGVQLNAVIPLPEDKYLDDDVDWDSGILDKITINLDRFLSDFPTGLPDIHIHEFLGGGFHFVTGALDVSLDITLGHDLLFFQCTLRENDVLTARLHDVLAVVLHTLEIYENFTTELVILRLPSSSDE